MHGGIPTGVIWLWIMLVLFSFGCVVFASIIAWTTPDKLRRLCRVPKPLLFIVAFLLTAVWLLGMLSVGWFVAPFAVVTWGAASVGWRDVRRLSLSGILSVAALVVLVYLALWLSTFAVRLAVSVVHLLAG